MELFQVIEMLKKSKKTIIFSVILSIIATSLLGLFLFESNRLNSIFKNKLAVENKDIYKVTAVIHVELKKESDSESYYGIYRESNYFNDFYFWCQSNYVTDRVLKKLSDMKFDELKDKIKVEKLDNSRSIKIIVYGKTIEEAIEIAELTTNVIVDNAKIFIKQIDTIDVIDKPINIYSQKEADDIKNRIIAKTNNINGKYGFWIVVIFGGITLGFIIGITIIMLKDYFRMNVYNAKIVHEILKAKLLGNICVKNTSTDLFVELMQTMAIRLDLLLQKNNTKKLLFISPESSSEAFCFVNNLAKYWPKNKDVFLYTTEEISYNLVEESRAKGLISLNSEQILSLLNEGVDGEKVEIWYGDLDTINSKYSYLLDLIDQIICISVENKTSKIAVENLYEELNIQQKDLIGYIFLQTK